VAEERYDLLVRGPDLESPFGRALREALASSAFQEALSRLPGYRADPGAGEVIWRSPPAPSLADAVPAAS
jgi:molybdate-binding protein